jgi:hypothetical protein
MWKILGINQDILGVPIVPADKITSLRTVQVRLLDDGPLAYSTPLAIQPSDVASLRNSKRVTVAWGKMWSYCLEVEGRCKRHESKSASIVLSSIPLSMPDTSHIVSWIGEILGAFHHRKHFLPAPFESSITIFQSYDILLSV